MSATATALKPVRRMEITVYEENGKAGYFFMNGSVMHRQGGFPSSSEAESAGRQNRALTLAYAHRFEPRIVRKWDNDLNRLVVTGWCHKCACGMTIQPQQPARDRPVDQKRPRSLPCSRTQSPNR